MKRKKVKIIRAEAIALSAMMAATNIMPVLADNVTPEFGIEASEENEDTEVDTEEMVDSDIEENNNSEGDNEEDLEDTESLEENTEDSESSEGEDKEEEDTEVDNDNNDDNSESDGLEEDTDSENDNNNNNEDTENSESENKEDTEEKTEEEDTEENQVESEEDTNSSDNEGSADENEEDTKEEIEEDMGEMDEDLENDLEEEPVHVSTPSNAEKLEEEPLEEEEILEQEIMLLSLEDVVYGEWNDSSDGNWQFLPSEDGTCKIKPTSKKRVGSVTVPGEVDGFIVTIIADSAWKDAKSLTGTITLPDSVKVIEDNAFNNCWLKKINFSGVEIIENYAFYDATWLETIDLSGVKQIGNEAFRYTRITDVDLSKIETIGERAFYMSSVKTVIINGIDTINNEVFYHCTSLTDVELTGVKNIGDKAFYECTSLTNINLEEIETISSAAFSNCTSLVEVDLSGADSIENAAFYKCKSLTNINLAEVKTIGERAFSNCSSLIENIDLAEVETIGERAFAYSGLVSVTLEDVNNIGHRAFDNCESLTTLSLTHIGTIGDEAFWNCTSLAKLNLSQIGIIESYAFNISRENGDLLELIIDKVDTLETTAFAGCNILKTITIDEVGTLKGSIFSNCKNLENITIGKADSIKGGVIYNCSNLKEVTIGEVETIESGSFNNLANLQIVTIHKVGTIKKNIFQKCNEVTNINIGKADIIKEYAFQDCTNLREVTIGEVETIESGSFKNCNNIISLNIDKVGTIKNFTFKGLQSLQTINIGEAGTIGLNSFEECINLTTLNISKANIINTTSFDNCTNLQTATIGEIDEIGSYVFRNCSALTDITLGKVGTIGNNAFVGCTSLERVNINNSNQDNQEYKGVTIGEKVFYQCQNLQYVDITGSVIKIGRFAFTECCALKEVNIGSIKSMDACAFALCENLSTLNWTNNMQVLPDFAFYKCSSLKEIDLGNITSIGMQALFGCNNIKELIIPEGVKSVYLVDLPGEYDYSGKADMSRGYKLIFLGDTNFEHYRTNSSRLLWYTPLGERDWSDSIIINELVLPSEETKAYKKVAGRDNSDEIPLIDDTKDTVIYHAVNNKPKAEYEDSLWEDMRVLQDNGGEDEQHTIINRISVSNEEPTVNESTVTYYINDGTDTIYKTEQVEDGNTPNLTDKPTREGYEFVEWCKDPEGTEKADLTNPITEDTKLYAKWKKIEDTKVKYKVTYYLNDGTPDIFKTEQVEDGKTPSIDIEPKRDGYKFIGWYKDTESKVPVDLKEPIKNTTELYAGWEKINSTIEKSTVTYYLNDGTPDIFKTEEVEKGKTPSLDVEPKRDGYEFTGWYKDPEGTQPIDPNKPITEDTEIYAGWEKINNTIEKSTVTYYLNDGTPDIFKTEEVEKGKTPSLDVEPKRAGYEFKGWYKDPEGTQPVDPNKPISEDTEIYAGWEKKDTPDTPDDNTKDKKKVTYYTNDGTPNIYKTEKIDEGKTPDISGEPKRDGYEFKGWYKDPEGTQPVDENEPINEDTKLYAGWEKKPEDSKPEKKKVTYYVNDGTPSIYKTEKIEEGKTPDTSGEPKRDGYEFIGWYKDPEGTQPIDPNEPITEDTEIYAGWKKKPEDTKPEKKKVTYYTNDGTDDIYKTEKIEEGKTPDISDKPKRDGYDFIGWFKDPDGKEPVDPNEPISEDTELYAGWKKKDSNPSGDDKPEDNKKEKVTITYHKNDGAEDITEIREIGKGEKPKLPDVPEREGYEFTGWYKDPEGTQPVDENTPIEENVDLYAGWKKKDTDPNEEDKPEKKKVTYYKNDGTPDIYKTEEIEEGKTPSLDEIPTRDGYEFTGWYKDPEGKEPIDPNDPISEDTKIYAGWKKDTIPTENGGSHSGGGSHSSGGNHSGGGGSTVIGVHDNTPEPTPQPQNDTGNNTQVDNQNNTQENGLDAETVNENGIPRDKAEEAEQLNSNEKDSLPKTGDKTNILVYWIALISSLSTMIIISIKDKARKIRHK